MKSNNECENILIAIGYGTGAGLLFSIGFSIGFNYEMNKIEKKLFEMELKNHDAHIVRIKVLGQKRLLHTLTRVCKRVF